jgi:hypothetical protein
MTILFAATEDLIKPAEKWKKYSTSRDTFKR